jgi:hypothetical protein
MTVRGARAVRAGWVTLFLGPPAAAAVLLPQSIASHQLAAVVLCLIYEGVAAATKFAGGVAGDLAARWRERLAERIDLMLRRQVSQFGRRYREFVVEGVQLIELAGLATVGYFTPALDDVFVDVSLAFRAPHKVPGDLLASVPADVPERRSLEDYLDRPEPEVLAVIGAPGSGKTTLLRHTARQACVGRRRRRVPILLYLRDHAQEIAARPGVGVADLVRGTLGPCGDSEPDGWFEQRLRNGSCIVLLDGLDEVAREEDRRSIASWVGRQIRQYPRNDYVVTSRPAGYNTARIDGAIALQVRDFTAVQVKRFVRAWYLAVARHDAGPDSEDRIRQAGPTADDLLRRLGESPALTDLTVNPLLLTMIVNVHSNGGGKLPGSRAELYGEICQVVLWRRQQAKNLVGGLGGEHKEVLLRGLAYTMMQGQVRDLPRDAVLAELGPALMAMPPRAAGLTAEDFLTDVGSNGLLVERENGMYQFAHQTFQEYLAAACIRDRGLVTVLAKSVDDAWWRETTLLYAALADATPIVQACLASATVTAITLALHCAEQGSTLAPEMVGHLEDLVKGASVPGTGPEKRRLIVAVLLAPHLREQIRVSDGCFICAQPVAAALYRLFLEDGEHPAPGPVAERTGDETALGMRASEADAFVSWLNRIVGGGAYRLPSRAEMDDMTQRRLGSTAPSGASFRSVWLASDGTPRELWVPPRTPHPYMIDTVTLEAHVTKDFSSAAQTLTRLLLPQWIADLRKLARDLQRARRQFLNQDSASPPLFDLHSIGHRGFTVTAALSETQLGRGGLGSSSRGVLKIVRALENTLISVSKQDYSSRTDPGNARARELDNARSLALDLASALDHVPGPSGPLDFALGLGGDIGTGTLVSQAISQGASGIDFFSRAFITAAGITGDGWVISPESLPTRLSAAGRELRGIVASIRPGSRRMPSAWMVEVADRFQQTAEPVFDRRVQLTRHTAMSIRIPALCLGAEADALAQRSLAMTFREMAAGITLLERRANGTAPATETILLATG